MKRAGQIISISGFIRLNGSHSELVCSDWVAGLGSFSISTRNYSSYSMVHGSIKIMPGNSWLLEICHHGLLLKTYLLNPSTSLKH